MPGSIFLLITIIGTSSITFVPLPGEELIVSSPPTARALSSILNRPTPR